MTLIGGGQINIGECTEAEKRQNNAVINQALTALNSVIELFLEAKNDTNIAGGITFNYTLIPDGETWSIAITRNGDEYNVAFVDITDAGDPPTYRAIRGLAKGDVTADDTTFPIDNVIPLACGADPVAGNPATEVTVQNVQKEAFEDNTPLTAIYDGANWEVLLVERYRMVRGEATAAVSSGSGTFAIDNIKVLGSGLDPRSDPTSATEQITVSNIHADTYAADDKVTAVFNVVDNVWEALKKAKNGTDGASGTFVCTLGGSISAGSTANMGTGTGTVYSIGEGTGLTSVGTRDIHNPFGISLPATSGGDTILYTCAKTWDDPDDEADDEYTITGIDPLHLLASLSGFAADKILYTDGTAETNIKWGGEECA